LHPLRSDCQQRPHLPNWSWCAFREDDYGFRSWVPWLTRDGAGPEYGQYVSAAGVGRWSTMAGPEVSEPRSPLMAAYLETVYRALTVGPADLMGSDVPGIVWARLAWENLEYRSLDDAFEHWTPIR
jgi:hypothetical protein